MLYYIYYAIWLLLYGKLKFHLYLYINRFGVKLLQESRIPKDNELIFGKSFLGENKLNSTFTSPPTTFFPTELFEQEIDLHEEVLPLDHVSQQSLFLEKKNNFSLENQTQSKSCFEQIFDSNVFEVPSIMHTYT